MFRSRAVLWYVSAAIQFALCSMLFLPSLAPAWEVRRPQGTLKVVSLEWAGVDAMQTYSEGLMALDKDNNWIPGLAEDWRWVNDRTLDFRLRPGVSFHNGEKFDAEAVRVNWEEYRKMETPRPHRFLVPSDETKLSIIDDYAVRFSFPEPDGLAYTKFLWYPQFAPAFFAAHHFDEKNWGYLPEAGPWGTGPFIFAEGNLRYAKPSKRIVLKAFDRYWDPRYPKVQKVIFENRFIGDREQAMRLCRETDGALDIVTRIRALDTLKVAESGFAKVIKSRDFVVLIGLINQRKRDDKWQDIRLRKAINYAINREELWKYAAKGNAHNLGGFIPPGASGYDSSLTPYDYDTQKAKDLIAAAGYASGFSLKIITMESWKLEAQIISRMLRRVGLTSHVDILNHPQFMRRIYVPLLEGSPEEQTWDVAVLVMGDWYGNSGASFLTWGFAEQSEMRWIKHNLGYEQMWKDMVTTVSAREQRQKIRQTAQYLHENAFCLFIYSPMSLYAVNKEVNFVPHRSTCLLLKESSVTENHWSVRGKNN